MSEADVAGSIITFVGAGHETTANTLAWTLFLLAKHPSVLSAVEAEIDACHSEDVARWPEQLVLTRAVVNEAMRLYPPAPIMSRIASVADEILGVKISRGSTIIIAPYIIHRHHSLWERPDYFHPERFLPSAKDKIVPYAFLPFGAGPRVCIGQRLSQVEAVIVLATLLRSFRFSLPGDFGVFSRASRHLTPRPKHNDAGLGQALKSSSPGTRARRFPVKNRDGDGSELLSDDQCARSPLSPGGSGD